MGGGVGPGGSFSQGCPAPRPGTCLPGWASLPWAWLTGGWAVSGQTQILDTSSLLRSCVQSAVGMLRDQGERCQRNVRRVELLLGLLTEEDGSEGEGRRGWAAAQAGAAGAWAPGSSFAADLAWPKKGRFPSRRPGARGGACGLGPGLQPRDLTSPLLCCSCFLTGCQEAPPRPVKEAGRKLPVQYKAVGGEGGLQPGCSPGGGHIQVPRPAPPGGAAAWRGDRPPGHMSRPRRGQGAQTFLSLSNSKRRFFSPQKSTRWSGCQLCGGLQAPFSTFVSLRV